MPGHRRPHLLPSLLVALVTMTGCGTSSPTDAMVRDAELVEAADARPILDEADVPEPGVPSPMMDGSASPGERQLPGELDPDGIYEQWLPVAMDRWYARAAEGPFVSRDVVCEHVTVDDCLQLPTELPQPTVQMIDWIRETDGQVVAPNEIIRATAVACLLLDEMSWEEQIVLLRDRGEVATDLSVLAYGTIALTTPLAVVFVCPEHEAATREQMTAVVCAEASSEACDHFVVSWPST